MPDDKSHDWREHVKQHIGVLVEDIIAVCF